MTEPTNSMIMQELTSMRRNMVTKDGLKHFATKEDLEGEVARLEVKQDEQFAQIDDQLVQINQQFKVVAGAHKETLNYMKTELAHKNETAELREVDDEQQVEIDVLKAAVANRKHR